MNYRRVGRTGLKISEISLGAWLTFGRDIDVAKTDAIISTALDHGVNFIDMADIYTKGEAERVVGEVIKDRNRSHLVLSSKVFWPMSDDVNDRGLSRKHIHESIDQTLRRIGTDYLDLYFCHRFDPETEVDEVVRAMDDLVRAGKILYWGTSVWSEAQIERAVGEADRFTAYRPVVEQPRYHMLDRHIETELLPICRRYGIGLTVWSPLAQGILTGKYNDGPPAESYRKDTDWLTQDLTEDNLDKVRRLTRLAIELGVTMSQLALAWVLRLPEISCAITGATRPDQVIDNVKASEIELSADLQEQIEDILTDDGRVKVNIT